MLNKIFEIILFIAAFPFYLLTEITFYTIDATGKYLDTVMDYFKEGA